MKIQRYRMPAGLRRAEHAQGCDEWIPFCSCGGLLLLRLEGKDFAEDIIAMCDMRDAAHGVICLSIYQSLCVRNGKQDSFCHGGSSRMPLCGLVFFSIS